MFWRQYRYLWLCKLWIIVYCLGWHGKYDNTSLRIWIDHENVSIPSLSYRGTHPILYSLTTAEFFGTLQIQFIWHWHFCRKIHPEKYDFMSQIFHDTRHSLKTDQPGKATIKLYDYLILFSISRRIRDGDTMFSKLYKLAQEEIFKKLDWTSKWINVNGDWVNHLRFADDALLLSSKRIYNFTIKEVEETSDNMFKINLKDTKIMFTEESHKKPMMETMNVDDIKNWPKFSNWVKVFF